MVLHCLPVHPLTRAATARAQPAEVAGPAACEHMPPTRWPLLSSLPRLLAALWHGCSRHNLTRCTSLHAACSLPAHSLKVLLLLLLSGADAEDGPPLLALLGAAPEPPHRRVDAARHQLSNLSSRAAGRAGAARRQLPGAAVRDQGHAQARAHEFAFLVQPAQ